ncbi:hypothetical protein CDD83_10676 [Cordyceps sp. RAO-2017]|nr:hypothetical protein CDD83_10676 [Cordyceps sp. RAO-2017]
MKEYHEVNLDEEPCIFPVCGHFLTVASMDGQMDMSAHYDLDENGLPTRISRVSEPFSMGESGVKSCASCRGSLRNVSRYGRIVRRALLDEATKKFITWSNAEYLTLAESLLVEQGKLQQAPAPTSFSSPGEKNHSRFALQRLRQLASMQELVGNGRYNRAVDLWKKISSYARRVRKEEQPFQRVAELVLYANRQDKTSNQFNVDESVTQVRGYLVAASLLLKCDIMIHSDFLQLRKRPGLARFDVEVDFSLHWEECKGLIENARRTTHPREEAQGHVLAAQLGWLCLGFDSYPRTTVPRAAWDESQPSGRMREDAMGHLVQARALLDKYPSTAVLKDEIDAAEAMLTDDVYRPVSGEEMLSIYRAMKGELRGTGHWYTCANGHPFTIDRCGMPMEMAVCPECGARIGGQNHVAAEGVRHAEEIEQLARDAERLQL